MKIKNKTKSIPSPKNNQTSNEVKPHKENDIQNQKNNKNTQNKQKPIEDERFAKASYDPRFLRPKK